MTPFFLTNVVRIRQDYFPTRAAETRIYNKRAKKTWVELEKEITVHRSDFRDRGLSQETFIQEEHREQSLVFFNKKSPESSKSA